MGRYVCLMLFLGYTVQAMMSISFTCVFHVSIPKFNGNWSAIQHNVYSQIECSTKCGSDCLSFTYNQETRECKTYTTELNDGADTNESSVLQTFKKTRPVNITDTHHSGLTSCSDGRPGSPSGIYNVTLTPGRSDDVYCDMDTDGGPWTLIQNRQDGTVDFYRNWTEYQTGFGDIDGEFWAGLNIIHLLTQNGSKLRINLMSWKNDTQYAEYQDFRVGDESSKYRLSVSGFSGNATYDGMDYHDGDQFSTYDNDNDVDGGNCAVSRNGAWWYKACSHSNLNGPYVQDTGDDRLSMWWWEFYSGQGRVPLMRSRMMVKHPGV